MSEVGHADASPTVSAPCPAEYLERMAIAIEPRSPVAVQAADRAASVELWHAYTVVFAAACVMTGVYWDISWHMSIGRDSFWTAAHLLIQAGGLIAGISSGYVALKTTFRGTEDERNA